MSSLNVQEAASKIFYKKLETERQHSENQLKQLIQE